MDTVKDFEGWLARNALRLKGQAAAAEELAQAFAGTADTVLRHDQAARLRNLRARVAAEVKDLEFMEGSARSGFTEGKLISGVAGFPAGLILGKLLGHKDPLTTGLDVTRRAFGRSAPFGTVVVAVGKHGIPDDVRVIPLSRLARKHNMSESEVRATLNSQGYVLTGPQRFAAAVDELERRVLDGAISFPLSVVEFSKVALSKHMG